MLNHILVFRSAMTRPGEMSRGAKIAVSSPNAANGQLPDRTSKGN